MSYAIEQWSKDGQRIEMVLARSSHALIARGAYEAAREHHPYKRLTLRQGCRMMAEHLPDAAGPSKFRTWQEADGWYVAERVGDGIPDAQFGPMTEDEALGLVQEREDLREGA